ncbi:hypothetical protein JXB28_01675 [Candidatus Woesearchaeota archaeon]|nr:hypothetical protein [Candidatus Woesearchaeota archaeon]
MLDYLLLLIISFLGLLAGLIIAYSAEEELQPGRKYMVVFKNLVMVLVLIVFCIKNPNLWLILLMALVFAGCTFSKQREKALYYALALMLFASWKLEGLALIAPLIFLYGLPLGSLYLHEHLKYSKDKKKILAGLFKEYSAFLLIGLVLWALGLFL